MKKNLSLSLLLLFVMLGFNNLSAQDIPLVYDVENTGEDCPEPSMLSFDELTSISSLPDPFEWSDGRGRISYYSDWKCRRAEIAKEIQHYEIGKKPVQIDTIEANFEDGTLTVDVTVNGNTLTLTSNISLPEGDGPHPVIIGMGSNPIPGDLFSARSIATMIYSHNQSTTYGGFGGAPSISDPFFQLYPEQDLVNTGQYAAWIWGVSRIIDGLRLVAEEANIDTERVAVSGCSYAGKMALFAGAFDERIALTFGIESGGGGYTTWRYSEILDEEFANEGGVETLGKTNYEWFRNSMNTFNGSVDRLPMDHHELMAMVAPRALFVTGNPGWTWLADESGYVGSKATEKVYEALGVADRFTYSQIGGHNHCTIPESQIPDIEAYLDKFLLGLDTNTNLSTSPYTTPLGSWIPWEVPSLSVGESLFERAVHLSPENKAAAVDTSVTFSWGSYEEAEKYYFQLSTDATFKTVIANDSTTNTEFFIDKLEKGKRYYWRIQLKNNAGEYGPWSNPWDFITSIELPGVPVLNSASILRATRPNYYEYTWQETQNANEYRIELSENESFTGILAFANTSETSARLFGTAEGNRYYWRVSAINIAGQGTWSEINSFFVIAPPDDIELESTGDNEITLTWDDNSDVEEGFIVERKIGLDGDYAIVDSLDENTEEWIDTEAQSGHFYRIKAYVGEDGSDYSEEVSVTPVSNEDEEVTPSRYTLEQNYPNPFNPATTISFSLPQSGLTKLVVYDLLGREMETLVSDVLQAGTHQIRYNAGRLASGIYLYKIQSGNFVQTRKMILMK